MSIPIGHCSSQCSCYQWFPLLLCICIFSTFPMSGLGIIVWLCSFGLPKQSHVGAASSLERSNSFCSSVVVKLWLYLENDRLHKLCINVHFILDCEKKKKICGETLFSILFDGYFKWPFLFQKQKYVYFSNHDHFWYPLEITLTLNMSIETLG